MTWPALRCPRKTLPYWFQYLVHPTTHMRLHLAQFNWSLFRDHLPGSRNKKGTDGRGGMFKKAYRLPLNGESWRTPLRNDIQIYADLFVSTSVWPAPAKVHFNRIGVHEGPNKNTGHQIRIWVIWLSAVTRRLLPDVALMQHNEHRTRTYMTNDYVITVCLQCRCSLIITRFA